MSRALLWGKLPAHGDFVARGLAPAARDELDEWLAASLAARETLGMAFEDNYDEAPPWRFAWREANGWAAGAMAPSVDGVGRHYPILLALSGLDDGNVDAATEAVENLLYEALGGDWNADRLHAAASALAFAPRPSAAVEGWWTLGAEHFTEARLAGARPRGLMAAMLTRAAGVEGERQDA